ncbi:hypothetical protein FO519_001137 [Halicephalobus sp. NKZ332]|nr:hypothetical protein FO519_001137 [Halicephalobus sp. NKZ332]
MSVDVRVVGTALAAAGLVPNTTLNRLGDSQMVTVGGGPGAVTVPADEQRKQASAVVNAIRRIKPELHLHNSEAVRVEEPQLFNPVDVSPHRITKVYTRANQLAQDFNQLRNPGTFADSQRHLEIGSLPITRKRFSRKKAFIKISHSVEKRNARERTRVHTVNQAFAILKIRLPTLRANTKRVSKLKILRTAIDYIGALRNMIKQDDQSELTAFNINLSNELKNSKLNEGLQRLSSEELKPREDPPLLSVGTSSLLPQPEPITSVFANNSALKLPYVGYENLYSSGYIPYSAYMPMATVAVPPVQGTSYEGVFYYQNTQTNDYTSLNTTNSFF